MPNQRIAIDGRTWPLLHRLFAVHVRPHWPLIAVSAVCMALAAAATAGLAQLIEPMFDEAFARQDMAILVQVAIGGMLLFVIKGLATYGHAVAMTAVGQRIVADLQERMFAALVRADLAFHYEHSPGRLVAHFASDTGLMRGAAVNALTGLGKDSLTLALLVAVMFYQDWGLALVSFIAFPAALVPMTLIGRRLRALSARTQADIGGLTVALDEAFKGAREVKAYGMEPYEISRVGAAIDTVRRLVVRAGRVRALLHPLMETLGGFAIFAVMVYGGHQVMTGQSTAGAFFSFITALLLAYEPMKRLVNLNADLQTGLAAAERIFALIDLRPRINDRPNAAPLRLAGGAISLQDVSFRYPSAETPALERVGLEVPAGATVALVGPSGAGKSTLLNLIPRFFEATAGSVTIDGQDVRDVTLASLRAALAIVSQEGVLFDDTVRANILYGRADAGEGEVIAAARAADAHRFISELPQGYDTPVGPRGVKLSGGQRQRIAIARAMLRDARILLLDEATSSLDSESERQVQAALRRLMQGRTTLVIAHRLSTVMEADRIYVLDRGRLVEWGTHAELVGRGGLYARFHALQFAPETDEAERESLRARA